MIDEKKGGREQKLTAAAISTTGPTLTEEIHSRNWWTNPWSNRSKLQKEKERKKK